MDETFLFFDIESANNFDGEGHICSFGYVLCDKKFNLLESEDIVMNPRSEFDPILFSGRAKCTLAYPREYFLSHPDFSFHYERIKNLLTTPGRKNIGFAVENDISFIVSACKNFSLPQIDFSAYDSHVIADRINNSHNGLSSWLKFYGVDTSSLQAHKSSDDAMMTMMLVKKLCETQKMSVGEFLAKNFFSLRTVEQEITRRKVKAYKKILQEKIAMLYNRRCRSQIPKKLKGKFKLALSTERDFGQIYDIHLLVFNNGGELVPKLCPGCTFVYEDESGRSAWMNDPKFSNIKFISLGELFSTLEMEGWEMKKIDVNSLPDM